MDKKEIGSRIFDLRKAQGLTQKELAAKLHVSDKSVSKWETGVHYPDIAIMENLAEELGISVIELLGLENKNSETVIDEFAQISTEEKIKILKQVRYRGWISIFVGIIIAASMMYSSYVFAKHNLLGWPIACTSGMLGLVGIIIGNGFVSVYAGRKLSK